VDGHRLERFAVPAAVDDRLPGLVGRQRRQDRAQAMHGVDAHPRPGRVRPLAAKLDVHLQDPLAAGLDARARRLAEHRGVAPQQVRGHRRDRQQAVVLPGHLLPCVEGEGDVYGWLRHRRGHLQQDRQTAFHIGTAKAPQGVTIQAGRLIVVRRNGIEMSRQHHAPGSSEMGAAHHIGADPGDLQACSGSQDRLDVIGQRTFLVTYRRDRHQVCGACQQIHVLTACRRAGAECR
jgi:hypothetical protein